MGKSHTCAANKSLISLWVAWSESITPGEKSSRESPTNILIRGLIFAFFLRHWLKSTLIWSTATSDFQYVVYGALKLRGVRSSLDEATLVLGASGRGGYSCDIPLRWEQWDWWLSQEVGKVRGVAASLFRLAKVFPLSIVNPWWPDGLSGHRVYCDVENTDLLVLRVIPATLFHLTVKATTWKFQENIHQECLTVVLFKFPYSLNPWFINHLKIKALILSVSVCCFWGEVTKDVKCFINLKC